MIKTNYMVCVKNGDYRASLELRKLYKRIPDRNAENRDMVRIVDESGEDYLYPASNFIPVRLTEKVRKAVAAAG